MVEPTGCGPSGVICPFSVSSQPVLGHPPASAPAQVTTSSLSPGPCSVRLLCFSITPVSPAPALFLLYLRISPLSYPCFQRDMTNTSDWFCFAVRFCPLETAGPDNAWHRAALTSFCKELSPTTCQSDPALTISFTL